MLLKKCQLASAIAVVLASSTTLVHANEENFEESFVWGTKVQSSSVFLGEQDIAIKQADHMSDLLRALPGIDIGGTHSVNTRINVRGLDDRDLSVYIDGALQTNYLYHHMGNLLINPDILKSADIEVGANSVVYGGLGGAIRFQTKDAQDLLKENARFGGRVLAAYHSNAQNIVSLTGYGLVGESIDYLVYYNRTDRDNFDDGSGQETIGNDGTTNNLLFKAGAALSDSHRLELSAEIYRDRGDYGQRPDMGYQAASGLAGGLDIPLFDTEYDRDTFNLGYEGDFSSTKIEANAYLNQMRLYRDESDGIIHPFGFVVPSTEKEVNTDNLGLNVLATTEVGAHAFNYGVEYFAQSLDYEPNLEDSSVPNQEQDATSFAVFIEDRITMGETFALTPGLRYSDYQMEVDTTNIDNSWDDISFALAADYRPHEDWQLLASYTQLFKGPELAEPFQGTGGTLLPNEDLDPETGRNVEAGLRYTHDFSQNTVLYFGFNLFQTRIEDYITAQSVAPRSADQFYVNSGNARIEGFEASLNLVFEKVELLLTYAQSDLDASELDVDDTTESLREIGDSVTFDLNADLSESFTANYNVLLVSDRERYYGGQDKEGYVVHNISFSYLPKFAEGLRVIAGVDNIFDEEYTSHASREGIAPFTTPPTILNDVEPGRNAKVSVAYEF